MSKDKIGITNILVTGGAGYAGSKVVRLLLSNNYNVIAVDNLSFGGESLLDVWGHPHFKFIKTDITMVDEVEAIFKEHRIDAIVHLAAIVGDPACVKQPELAKKVNWQASLDVLNLAQKHQVKRFIFASTCSNYGKMKNVDVYVDEASSLNPVSLYAELKVKFEDFILNRIKKDSRFCPTALRFATIYGVSPRMRFDLTVNEFTKELALGRELQVFGEQFWRPYCHVSDFAIAVELVLRSERGKVAYNVFNVGDAKENYQKLMIVEEIKKVIPDAKIHLVHKDEDPRDYKVSFEKIKHNLGFVISRTVQDGIREVKSLIVNGAIANPDDSKYSNS